MGMGLSSGVPTARCRPLRTSAAWAAASWSDGCFVWIFVPDQRDLQPDRPGNVEGLAVTWAHTHTHTPHPFKVPVHAGGSSGGPQRCTATATHREEPSQFPFLLWQTHAEIWFQIKPASISLMARVQDLESNRFLSPVLNRNIRPVLHLIIHFSIICPDKKLPVTTDIKNNEWAAGIFCVISLAAGMHSNMETLILKRMLHNLEISFHGTLQTLSHFTSVFSLSLLISVVVLRVWSPSTPIFSTTTVPPWWNHWSN